MVQNYPFERDCQECQTYLMLNYTIDSSSSPVQRTQPPALPNGHVIESVAVESLGPATWMVHLTPAACGTGIDLLQLANAVVVDGNSSSDRVLYANRTTNGTVLVSRAHAATPPIEGTFGVSLGRHRVEGTACAFSQC